MSIFCRKAEEREQRDLLILSIAREILQEQGVAALSMQAVADRTRYSKGTIYQHYASKEDLVARLMIECGRQLQALLGKAAAYDGSTRCRVALGSAAFLLNASRNASIVSLVPTVKSAAFMQKVSAEHATLITQLDQKMLQMITGIFDADPDLKRCSALQAAFGWWAMMWGLQEAIGKGWNLQDLGIDNPLEYFNTSLQVYLDGLEIKPDLPWQDWRYVLGNAVKILEE